MGKLFKLKFYCNYCRKQCVDENGFRVHCSTFSHKSAVDRYNADPEGNRSAASSSFLDGFCSVLQGFAARQKLRKGVNGLQDDWVDSNLVYQEYIKDRHHIHLQATRWKSVAGFLRFLRSKGIAEVKRKKMIDDSSTSREDFELIGSADNEGFESQSEEDSEEGDDTSVFEKDPRKRPKWVIRLIDKSPEAVLAAKNRESEAKSVSESGLHQFRQMTSVQKQAQAAAAKTSASTNPIVVTKSAAKSLSDKPTASIFAEDDSEEEADGSQAVFSIRQKRNAVLDELVREEEELKRTKQHPHYHQKPQSESYSPKTPIEIDLQDNHEIPWIRKGLLIKVNSTNLESGKYLGALAVIDEVIEEFGAQATVLKSGDQLLLDQDDCLPVGKVSDQEFDEQLANLDRKILSSALKNDRCILVASGLVGKDGKILQVLAEKGLFKIEIIEAGSSRKHVDLKSNQFCIYWE